MKDCPYCGQRLPVHRMGVEFTRLEGKLFDLIVQAGDGGITNADLYDLVFSGRQTVRHTLNVHIHNINNKLTDTGYQIVGREIRVLKKWGGKYQPADALTPAQQRALGL